MHPAVAQQARRVRAILGDGRRTAWTRSAHELVEEAEGRLLNAGDDGAIVVAVVEIRTAALVPGANVGWALD